DRALERMEPEIEGGRDPEVRACTPHAPEELRMLVRARSDDAAVRGHELDAEQVVDREAEATLQPAHAAAEGEAADAGMRDDPDRADEAVRLGGIVKLAEQRTA